MVRVSTVSTLLDIPTFQTSILHESAVKLFAITAPNAEPEAFMQGARTATEALGQLASLEINVFVAAYETEEQSEALRRTVEAGYHLISTCLATLDHTRAPISANLAMIVPAMLGSFERAWDGAVARLRGQCEFPVDILAWNFEQIHEEATDLSQSPQPAAPSVVRFD